MVVGYVTDHDVFAAGKPQVRFVKRLDTAGGTSYDLAPDGRRFAVVLYAGGTSDQEQKPIDRVTVLLNFFDELLRRVPARGK
jgi:hypothetical protein